MDNQELVTKKPNKIKLIIIISLLIIAAIILFIVMNKKNKSSQLSNQPAGQGQNATGTNQVPSAETTYNSLAKATTSQQFGTPVVPGANQVSPNNLVVTDKGALTDNAVAPMSDTAPKQTDYIKKADLPAQVLQVNIGNDQFSPKEFSTTKEMPTTFSLTSIDDYSHFITFDDPSMMAVKIFVGPRQTKAITFNAPKNAGVYIFSCGIPGHAGKGEVGKMIVK